VHRLLAELVGPSPGGSPENVTGLVREWRPESELLVPLLEEALSSHRDVALRTLRDLLGPAEAADQADDESLDRAQMGGLLPVLRRLAVSTSGAGGPGGSGSASPGGSAGGANPGDLTDRTVRSFALVLLGRLAAVSGTTAPGTPADEAAQVLAQAALTDPSVELRQQAAAILARRDPARSGKVIEALLSSPDRRLRLCALHAAAALSDPSSLPAAVLSRAQRDPDGYVREAAARLLARKRTL
jgi:hypothetical protein